MIAPFLKTSRTTRRIMLEVLIALVPAGIAGIVFFGWQAAVIILLALASAFCSEFLFYIVANKFWKTPLDTLRSFFRSFDFTSLVTGLLLAYSLPASITGWYLPLIGSAFAILIVKMLFGGTGKNLVNPAMAARVLLFLCFTSASLYPAPLIEPMTGATQLNALLAGEKTLPLYKLFSGNGVVGCIGETCKLALLLGGIYLAIRGVIKWYLPLLLLGTAGLTAALLQTDFEVFLPSLFTGGITLGAIFMATDYVTSPKSRLGNFIYFPLLGVLIALTRHFTGTETTSFCILFMNFAVFPLDALVRARPFGSGIRRRPHEKAKTV